jgi:hypothetical protein
VAPTERILQQEKERGGSDANGIVTNERRTHAAKAARRFAVVRSSASASSLACA